MAKATLLGLAAALVSVIYERPVRSTVQGLVADPAAIAAREASLSYAGCDEVRRAGAAPIYAGEPGYRAGMDGDHDGIACEPLRAFGP